MVFGQREEHRNARFQEVIIDQIEHSSVVVLLKLPDPRGFWICLGGFRVNCAGTFLTICLVNSKPDLWAGPFYNLGYTREGQLNGHARKLFRRLVGAWKFELRVQLEFLWREWPRVASPPPPASNGSRIHWMNTHQVVSPANQHESVPLEDRLELLLRVLS